MDPFFRSSQEKLSCNKSNGDVDKDSDNNRASPKTVNIVIGFFFLINYELGMGFLGIPFAFFHEGMIAGVITLLLAAFATCNTATWVLEVMARAQAIHSHKENTSVLPKFEVLHSRKFEFSELCAMFLGRWSKYALLLVVIAFTFLACLGYSTVAGTSWAVNIPFNFHEITQCTSTDFQFLALPVVIPCRNAYWLCLALFGCIVVPLSMIELREQTVVQVIWSLLRFIAIGVILIFCIANLITTGNICTCSHPWEPSNASEDIECNISTTFSQVTTKFNVQAWTVAIPVIVTALNLHQGIPALTHPIKQKKHLGTLMNFTFVVITTLYMMLGVVVSLWWKDCINETCSLNWDPLSDPSYDLALRILSYFIMLFPSIDVISIYPLIVLTMVNNTYIVVFGKDSAQASKAWTSFFVLLVMKFIAALLPILVAMAVSNLVIVLKYAGLMAFFLAFFIPTCLQLRSQWVCKQTFANVLDTPHSHELQESSSTEQFSPDPATRETHRLISTPLRKSSDLYMTPYSNVFSYWPVVLVIGVLEVFLFVLAISGLFLSNTKRSIIES